MSIRLSSVLVVVVFLLSVPVASAPAAEKSHKLSARKLNGLLGDMQAQVFYGGLMISAKDTLAGPVVVIAGALDIQDSAALAGDAWVIDGSLILNGSARVLGRVDLVNSGEFLSHEASVTGGISHYTCECRLDVERFEKQGKPVFRRYEDPRVVKTKLSLSGGEASRVDYNVIRAGLVRQNPRCKKPHVRGHALLHFPWRENTRGYLGFDVDVAVPIKGERADLLVRGYKKTFTNDDWQLSREENSWILDLAGNDYPDYYEIQGGGLGLRARLRANLLLETIVSFQREVSLIAKSSPSLFYPQRKLRDNPPIDEGERLAVTGVMIYDTREDSIRPQNAWYLSGWMEKGIADGPGDFSYTAFCIDARRYTLLPLGFCWDMRARMFSSFDALPGQVTQSLNGYGGVRGQHDIPFDVRRGNRLGLASVELRKGLPALPIIRWIFTRWDLLAFADLGLLTNAANPGSPFGFLDTGFDRWRKSIGLGITGESFVPYIGVYVAQDLDRRRHNPRVIVRAIRSF